MLDNDLVELCGAEIRASTQAVRQNTELFPSDFMFRLIVAEYDSLSSQIVTSENCCGRRRYPPYAFTEHGAVMLAGALNSGRAIEAGIFVVRGFVRVRGILSLHKELARRISEQERRVIGHDNYIKLLMKAIKKLIALPVPAKRQIGFREDRLPGQPPNGWLRHDFKNEVVKSSI